MHTNDADSDTSSRDGDNSVRSNGMAGKAGSADGCWLSKAHVRQANETSQGIFILTGQMILLFLSRGMLRLNDSPLERKTLGLN